MGEVGWGGCVATPSIAATWCHPTGWQSRGQGPEFWHRHARLCGTAGSRKQLAAPAVPTPENQREEL